MRPTFKAALGARSGAEEYKFLAPKDCAAVHVRGTVYCDQALKFYVVSTDGEVSPVGYSFDGEYHINRRFNDAAEFVIRTGKKTAMVHADIEMSVVHCQETLDPTPVAIADETTIERQLRGEDFIRREMARHSAAAEDATEDSDDLPFDEDQADDEGTAYQELDTITESERLRRLAEQTEAQAEADPAPEAPGPSEDVTREEGQLQQETETPS